jgi:hypothetical protein
MAPVLPFLVLSSRIPESPKWLISNNRCAHCLLYICCWYSALIKFGNRREEAATVLKKLRGDDETVQNEVRYSVSFR